MRVASLALLWSVALGLSAGCGGSSGTSGDGSTSSCQAAFPGADGGAGMAVVCIEASGASAPDVARERQQCSAEGNTFLMEPCPRAQALGGCRETTTGPGPVLTTWYYQDGLSTADDIRMLCDGLASVAPATLRVEFVTP